MRLLAYILAIAFTYLTYKLYLQDSVITIPSAIFTLLTYWFTYEAHKCEKI